MKQNLSSVALATLAVVAALCSAGPAAGHLRGSTTNVTESTTFAPGWSVKKTLMGKLIYNDAGVKVGKVEDLIVSPDKNVSYVIVGAGGFVGIDRHDVAIAVSQIQDKAGKLLLPGATPATIKALPEFTYATGAKK
jgi:sporulation protein YlmC with PRC-barrel domain